MTNTTIITAANLQPRDKVIVTYQEDEVVTVSRVRMIDHQRLRIDFTDGRVIIAYRNEEFEKETPLEP